MVSYYKYCRRWYSQVDNNEVKHFQKLASEWWNNNGELRLLHKMNVLRVPLVRDGLFNTGIIPKEKQKMPTPLKNISILEVGCGGGILIEALNRLGANTTGVDVTKDLIEIAKAHAEQEKLTNYNYVFSTIKEYANANEEKYDAVVSSEVVEHVNDKKDFLRDCVKCLKPGGSIFITTINKTILADLFLIRMAENVLNLIPKGTHQIEKFIEPYKLQKILEDGSIL